MTDEQAIIEDDDPIHTWFELSYSSYLVLPRSVLQSLPTHLQKQLVDALNAIEEHLSPAAVPPIGTYSVNLRDKNGRYMKDPLCQYERGRRVVTKEDLLELGKKKMEYLGDDKHVLEDADCWCKPKIQELDDDRYILHRNEKGETILSERLVN